MKYKFDFAIKKNNLQIFNKPLEDYFLINEDLDLFIIADGVSRDLVNDIYPQPSPASEVAILTCHLINFYLKYGVKDDMKNIILKVNDEIKKYNSINNYKKFLPGTTLLMALIKNDELKLYYIGDSSAYLFRNKQLKKITNSQTDKIKKFSKKLSKEYIREKVCNNLDHPYSYGVLNGDKRAGNFIQELSFKIKSNDIIILSSDGLDNLFENHQSVINKYEANHLIELAEKFDSSKSDDKTVILISIL